MFNITTTATGEIPIPITQVSMSLAICICDDISRDGTTIGVHTMPRGYYIQGNTYQTMHLSHEKSGVYVRGEDAQDRFFNLTDFQIYFILVADQRDKKIDQILND
jgi:hypothetical protein